MTTLMITPIDNGIAGTDKTIIFDGEASGAVSIAADAVEDATLSITDDDIAGVTVGLTALSLLEGNARPYTLKLNTQPSADVTITPTSSDLTAATLVPAALTFTASNWEMPQTMTVVGKQDDDAVPDTATISHTMITGASEYESPSLATVGSVAVTIRDNDRAGVTVTPLSLGIAEGATGTYTLALTTTPSANVMITPASSADTVATLTPTVLTFTPSNWNTAQTITVTGVQDGNDDEDTTTISHVIAGYGSVNVASVTVTVADGANSCYDER